MSPSYLHFYCIDFGQEVFYEKMSVLTIFHMSRPQVHRARNNDRTYAGHHVLQNTFLEGHNRFLEVQKL